MVAMLAGNNFKCIFWNEYDIIPIRISHWLKFVQMSLIDKRPTFVQVKPLPEQMLTQFTDAYMRD